MTEEEILLEPQDEKTVSEPLRPREMKPLAECKILESIVERFAAGQDEARQEELLALIPGLLDLIKEAKVNIAYPQPPEIAKPSADEMEPLDSIVTPQTLAGIPRFRTILERYLSLPVITDRFFYHDIRREWDDKIRNAVLDIPEGKKREGREISAHPNFPLYLEIKQFFDGQQISYNMVTNVITACEMLYTRLGSLADKIPELGETYANFAQARSRIYDAMERERAKDNYNPQRDGDDELSYYKGLQAQKEVAGVSSKEELTNQFEIINLARKIAADAIELTYRNFAVGQYNI